MTLPREDGLKLLGLWPRWRRKDASAPAEAVEQPDLPAPPAVLRQAAEPETPSPVMPAAPRHAQPVGNRPADMDWPTLRQAVQACSRCELAGGRTQGVFGTGDVQAEWLFVGEAPGADEDRLGEPFVGQAGKLLDAMLAAIGLRRGDNVYIANVLKSRPPGNRDPKPEEVAACLPYLERQIDLLRPRIIVALGRFAAQSLLLTDTPISRLRGRVHEYRGVPLVVTYHPAYLLRNPIDKAKTWEDLCLARDVWAAHPVQASGPPPSFP